MKKKNMANSHKKCRIQYILIQRPVNRESASSDYRPLLLKDNNRRTRQKVTFSYFLCRHGYSSLVIDYLIGMKTIPSVMLFLVIIESSHDGINSGFGFLAYDTRNRFGSFLKCLKV